MAAHRLTFLIGGSDAYEGMAGPFLAAAGGPAARIALLLQGGDRWPQYVLHYARPWMRRGVNCVLPVAPRLNEVLDLERARNILQAATGIFIGGGNTPTYHRLYGTGPVAALIRERYERGVPIAGVSAGAMVLMEQCVFLAEETPTQALQVVPGLGLVRDLIIGVHYTEQNALPDMIEAMVLTRTTRGLGIDDGACAVFDDGAFAGALGQSFYDVEMRDFERRRYTCTERALI